MRTALIAAGLGLIVLGLAGCAEQAAMGSPTTARQECERSGGAWRNERCESSAGGGY